MASGLALAGAGTGAAVGTVLLATSLATGPGGASPYDWPLGAVFGGTFGAVIGVFAAPLVGFAVLRYVPLGRAFGYGAVGTLAGGWIGLIVADSPILGGLAGFVVSLALARWRTRQRDPQLASPPE